jgi:two-component system, cell cycle sensor histidine kinase and response regulator CckA
VPPSSPPEWYARLSRALGSDDPEQARAEARALLGQIHDEEGRVRERLEMLSGASFEGIMVHVDGVVIDANQHLCELLGYELDEVLGPQTLLRCVAPEDLPSTVERISSQYEGAYVITGVRKDGSRFRAELQSKQGRIGDRPVRVVAVRDVTERERTDALLRESEQRFRDLARAAFDFMVFTREGVIVDVDGDCDPVLGVGRERMLGRPVLEFVAPSAQPLVQQRIQARNLGSYEAVALHARGELVPVLCVITSTTLNGRSVRAAALRDLRPVRRLEAERRTLEQLLERSQRLDSLGVLAGGIAHDFNNLLVGVLGNAELLREMLASPAEREMADAIVTAANRAAALTRQMLAYAGQRDLGRRQPVEIAELLGQLRALLGATLSKKAQVVLKVEAGSVVQGDPATLSQVLMNLLTNASDALADRPGVIEVRARRVTELDARWDSAQGATVGPGDWVLIEVRDTGIGMDDTTRGRVFEPFFSTKERGHGLGLAACLGIVSAHGGAVLVESQIGRGSCFSVLLPASRLDPAAVGRPPSVPAGRPCKVLIVDDEGLVRAQLRRLLELRGYVVVEASDGRAGLAAVEENRPDVVILDMTMPDIDGAEVLLRLRASGSRVPVIISSGYLDAAVELRLPRGQFQGFLAKPYGASDLAAAIDRALARE